MRKLIEISGFWLRRLRREERGSAILELSLILAALGAPLVLGTAEMGMYAYYSIEVSNAAHAGAMMGMMSSTYAGDTSDIQTAAQNEAPDFGTGLTVTPTIYWVCSNSENGTQYTTEALAVTACTGTGNHALEYISVQASGTATPPVSFPGIASSWTLSSTSVMEVEE